MATVLILVLAAIALAYVLSPFWRATTETEQAGVHGVSHRIAELQNRKREALTALKDAEFDLQMNKLTREDYEAIRRKYARIALEAIEEIERLNGGAEDQDAVKPPNSARYCPRCGAKQKAAAIFCFACGYKLGPQPFSSPALEAQFTSAS